MECELELGEGNREERKEKTEKGELGLGLDEALYIVISLDPVGDTNRD